MNPPIVYVLWDDSSVGRGWVSLPYERPLLHCKSVGFLIAEDEGAITLSSSLAMHDGAQVDSATDPISIPRDAIKALWYVEGVE